MSENWATIEGFVERGHLVASGQSKDNPYPAGTIEMQIPFFQKLGLDLSSYFRSTLNVSIRPYSFAITNPEYTFRNVEWTTEHPPEDFSFSRCQIVANGAKYDAWVYYPHLETKKRHFQNPSVIEVIAPFIPNLEYGDKVEIVINTDEIQLDKTNVRTDKMQLQES